MTEAVSMPLVELIEDLTIYPRTQVSSVNVSNLVSALRSGCELPPLVADRASKRVVDGFHRRRAHLRVSGSDGNVLVELRDYQSDAEMFCAAIEYNAAHGLPLQEIEKRKVVLRLQDDGVDDETIAKVLHIPTEKVEKIRIKTATVALANGSIRLEPLKRPAFHFQGKSMSEKQAEVHKSAPGTSYVLIIQQLRDALVHNMLNREDGRLITELNDLSTVLDRYLSEL